eukprot:g26593.t1
MLLLSVTRLKCLARGGAGGAKSKMRGGPAALFAVRVLPAACACARSYGSESTSTGDTSAPPPPLARKPSEVIGLPSYHGNAPRLEETMERKLTSPRIMPIQNLGTHSVGVSRRVVAARNKCVSINDAVMAVVSHDTLVCSGFQGQGGPEGLLRALAERYVRTGAPHSLTLLFNAGPGDTNTQGLNNLALTVEDVAEDVRAKYPDLPPMVARTVGSHYGVLPKLSELILKNKIEAFTLPIGVTTRIVRCAAGHQPGLFSTTGMHTYIDPRLQGGKINQKAKDSKFSPVSLVQVDGMDHLFYRAMPVHVAFIRATTADPDGNLTMEHESLMAEQRNIAMAAKNSGGVVIAQVKRVAQSGSLPIRNVAVPGCFVDCVVVISPDQYDELHPMSYATPHNPSLTHEVRPTLEDTPRMPLTNRKVIARRASMLLKANKVINLGIGLPEHIASVCAEEDILQQLVLSTEAGCLGGVPAFNADYGPAASPMALQEMNQQYDFYGGGGLDICFLGAGAVNELGHVQVFSHTNVRGPGAFIDISQNTRNVIFLMNFKIKGLQVEVQDGRMNIKKEGKVRKFVAGPLEDVAFSAAEAWRRGQEIVPCGQLSNKRSGAAQDFLSFGALRAFAVTQKASHFLVVPPKFFHSVRFALFASIFFIQSIWVVGGTFLGIPLGVPLAFMDCRIYSSNIGCSGRGRRLWNCYSHCDKERSNRMVLGLLASDPFRRIAAFTHLTVDILSVLPVSLSRPEFRPSFPIKSRRNSSENSSENSGEVQGEIPARIHRETRDFTGRSSSLDMARVFIITLFLIGVHHYTLFLIGVFIIALLLIGVHHDTIPHRCSSLHYSL